jgi:AraC-like DNA-binding protein/tetratricopeptide (TPR) repeat protein
MLETDKMVASTHHAPTTPPLPRSVRRALDAMHANVGHPWRISELAEVAGVSARTLQRQFMSFLGKAPGAVLRDIGFERARRDLLRGALGEKVMDVAARCGFPHYGRFAVAYRRRYGETPSQTLRRQARLAAELAAQLPVLMPSRDRPLIAFAGIEAGMEAGVEAGIMPPGIAAGLADDLVIALHRAGLAVTRQVPAARYQLLGAFRGPQSQERLVLQLIDRDSGRQLWAHRIEGILHHEPESQERLAMRIAAALQPSLRLAEIERVQHKPESELAPHELALRALPGVLSLDAEGNSRALDLLERAIDRNPDNALAAALAAWAHVQRVVYHFTSAPQQERERSIELARKARALPGDATVLAVLGSALTLLDDLDAADLVIRRALSTDGGSAWAWSRSGWIDVYRGNADSAIERLKIALDLAPHDPLAFNSMVGIGCANFKAGNYVEAARWQERALLEHPSAVWVHRTLGPAYLLSGFKREAGRSLDALRTRYPDLTLSEVQQGMPPLPESYRNLVFEALSDIGLPA